MSEMSRESIREESASEKPATLEPTQSSTVQEKASFIEPQNRLAKSIKEDPRMGEIRQQLISEWRNQNGSEWITNFGGGLDFRPDFQDWRYGSNKQWRSGGKPPTLDSRAEEEFRKRFPEDATTYDQMERIRIYDRPDQDPAISRLQSEITRLTKLFIEHRMQVEVSLVSPSEKFGIEPMLVQQKRLIVVLLSIIQKKPKHTLPTFL